MKNRHLCSLSGFVGFCLSDVSRRKASLSGLSGFSLRNPTTDTFPTMAENLEDFVHE